MLAFAILLTTWPSSLDCIDAHRKRSDLAGRMGVLLMREVDTGRMNRAELGAYRAMRDRREWLLACPPEREL